MKYQVLKQLKTKNKLIKLCDTLQEAKTAIENTGAKFHSLSYVGQFPTFTSENENGQTNGVYTIQGLANIGVVCSLSKEDLATF